MGTIAEIFSDVVLMSCMACVVIPVVWMARGLVGRVSKRLCFLMWGIVALRLVFPVMLPSGLSVFGCLPTVSRGISYVRQLGAAEADDGSIKAEELLPDAETEKAGTGSAADAGAGKAGTGSAADGAISESSGKAGTDSVAEAEAGKAGTGSAVDAEAGKAGTGSAADGALSEAFGESGTTVRLSWYHAVWLLGMAVMLSYAGISCLFIKRKLRTATRKEADIYESDVVNSPFVFGILHPVIYIPYHLQEKEFSCIAAHERYHIRRRDYLTGAFAYLLLCMYWFHPLVWLSYRLFQEDMEESCDEAVLRGCSMQERRAYAEVLLAFAKGRRTPAAGLGFGEGSMKNRMKYILREKKKNLWATGAAVLFAAAVACVCLTDQASVPSAADQAAALSAADQAEAHDVSEAAAALFADANPYIGDASANGRLLGTIHTYLGGLSGEFTTELQTSEEPYTITLHFAEKPTDEEALWRDAVLFLALTENCGEVRWDYEESSPAFEAEPGHGQEIGGGWVYVEEEWMPSEESRLVTYYVSIADANANLGVDDIKAYAASPEGVDELLGLLADMNVSAGADDAEYSAENDTGDVDDETIIVLPVQGE